MAFTIFYFALLLTLHFFIKGVRIKHPIRPAKNEKKANIEANNIKIIEK
jgi:hypothetical protein